MKLTGKTHNVSFPQRLIGKAGFYVILPLLALISLSVMSEKCSQGKGWALEDVEMPKSELNGL